MQQQEEQLAAHLEEKRRQLEEWSERNRAERETWLQEKAEHERHLAEEVQDRFEKGKRKVTKLVG